MSGWRELVGYVSAAGIKNPGRLSVSQIIQQAADIYCVPTTATCDAIAGSIKALGRWRRKRCCKAFRALNRIPHPQAGKHPRHYADGKVPQTACLPQNQPNYQAPKSSAAPTEKMIREFYDSWDWKRLSYDVKVERGRKCECCGARAPDVRVHTDHVKPIRKHWHLRLVRSNLQILCEDCNMGKGSRDETDFRAPKAPRRPPDAVSAIDYSDDPRSVLDGPMPANGVVIWN